VQTQPSPWARAFQGFEDLDDDDKRRLTTQFLQAAAPMFQNAQVVPKPNDDEIQLRGVYSGYPTRVLVDTFWDITVDMKAPNAQREPLCVRFDPNREPSAGDVDPWDEHDDVRVFLARGVFVENSARDLEQTLRVVQALPLDFRGHLFSLIQLNLLSSVTLNGDGPRAAFRHNLGEMWDPMTQLAQILWLCAYGASVYAALPPPRNEWEGANAMMPPEIAPAHRAQCGYCRTIYLLGPDSVCPNCGAPYTG
jgi:hypothetical protein